MYLEHKCASSTDAMEQQVLVEAWASRYGLSAGVTMCVHTTLPPPEVMTLVAESEIPVGYCVTFIKSIFSRILRTLFVIFNRKMFFFKRALRYN